MAHFRKSFRKFLTGPQLGRRDDGDYSDSFDNDVDWYHITDVQFSTVAMIDSTAKMYERIAYSPYGQAEHFWMGDCVWDSSQSSYRERDIDDDREIQWLSIADNGNPVEIDHADYNVDADLNRDGQITSADWSAATSDNPYGGFSPQYRNPLAAGQLSYFENQIGYDGYIFNEETEQYCVRFRTYDPQLGRWLERDPARYVDGMNLYQNVLSRPITAVDPFGLDCEDKCEEGVTSPVGVAGYSFRSANRGASPEVDQSLRSCTDAVEKILNYDIFVKKRSPECVIEELDDTYRGRCHRGF